MPQISFQLHATLEDLRDLVIRWASAQTVSVAAQQHSSAWVPLDSPDDLGTLTAVGSGLTRITLSQGQAPHGADPDLHGMFVIHAGTLTDEGLRESAMGAVHDDPEALNLWGGLIRRARAEAHVGASVVNPTTEARMHAPSHRHLPGAHDLASSGVVMLAAAGWNRYEFDDLA